MKKLIGYLIAFPVLLFGAIGNYHLYKESGDWNDSLRNTIVLTASVGLEIAVLLLLHALAQMNDAWNKKVTSLLLVIAVPVSLLGQYNYLLKEASVKTAKAATAQAESGEISEIRNSLQSQLTIAMQDLQTELASGDGPKARSKKEKVDALQAKIDSYSTTKAATDSVAVEVTELTVFANEFGLDPNLTMKIAIGIFLTIANLVGFWLVYLADVSASVPVPVVAAATLPVPTPPAPKKRKPSTRKPSTAKTKTLPPNVIPLYPTARKTALDWAN